MTRFLVVQLGEPCTLAKLFVLAQSFPARKEGATRGYEVLTYTERQLSVMWAEKIVSRRTIDAGPLGLVDFENVDVVEFSLLLFEGIERVIVVNPPAGKEKLFRALRGLGITGGVLVRGINVRNTIRSLEAKLGGILKGFETRKTEVEGLMVSISAIGPDPLARIDIKFGLGSSEVKVARLRISIPQSKRHVMISVSRLGIVSCDEELSDAAIVLIAERLAFSKGHPEGPS